MKKIIVILSFTLINEAISQTNVLTTAAPYLRIAADARASGMGDAGITAVPDGAAVFWNSAKSLFAEKKLGVQLTYTSWFREVGAKDIYLLAASGYSKLNESSSVTFGIRYYSQGTINSTSVNGEPLGRFRPREFDFNFGYNRKFNNKMGAGVMLRLINSVLGGAISSAGGVDRSSVTLAGDFSLYYNGEKADGSGLNWGVSISNLGGKLGFRGSISSGRDFIPANLGFGLRYGWALDDKSVIRTAFETNKLLVPAWPNPTGNIGIDSANLVTYKNQTVVNSWFKSFSDGSGLLSSFSLSFGAEYIYDKKFGARVGYFTEDQVRGNRKFFTAGLSAFFKGGGVNLSYLVPTSNSNRNVLNNTIRIGIVFE
jgi:hypothetical protein